MRLTASVAGCLVALTALVGCGSDEPPDGCVTLGPDKIADISDGLEHTDTTVTAGAALPLPPNMQQFGMTALAAVTVGVGSDTDTAHLALSSTDPGSGQISAVDHIAKHYFSWGPQHKTGRRWLTTSRHCSHRNCVAKSTNASERTNHPANRSLLRIAAVAGVGVEDRPDPRIQLVDAGTDCLE